MTVRWVPRSAWTDIAARGGNNSHNGPKSWARKADTVIVHYVGSSGSLSMPKNPAASMESIQKYGWSRDGAGIEYGAITFHDGSTWGGFEGEVGAHCATTDPRTGKAWNYSSWGLCAYLGVGNPTVPDDMFEGLAFAIRHAIAQGWLTPDPAIIGHRDTGFSTSCPGPALTPRLDELARRAVATTPPEGAEDMTLARRIRFRGWWNQYLAGAGGYQPVTEELLAAGWDQVPLVVMDWHEQTVAAIQVQCGPQTWVPSDGS